MATGERGAENAGGLRPDSADEESDKAARAKEGDVYKRQVQGQSPCWGQGATPLAVSLLPALVDKLAHALTRNVQMCLRARRRA